MGLEVHIGILRLITRKLSLGLQGLASLALATGCYSTADSVEAGRLSAGAKCITPDTAENLADQVLQLVNLARAEEALQPVVVNEKLQQVAEDYSCRMVEEGFFGHEDPVTGESAGERVINGKYLFHDMGENLAAGQSTAAEVMKAWMDSPSHRAVILDPRWKEVGIAVRGGGEYSTYWVQEFGDPFRY